MINNIDKIKKEIIEKVKNNPGYLHPCNIEHQKDMKIFGFDNGYRFICYLQQIGILKNPIEVRRQDKDEWARVIGFKDFNEYRRDWNYQTGMCIPSEANEDCPTHFGNFTENFMIQTFEDAIKMRYGNPGFDWTCKKGDKIDNKARCLTHRPGKSSGWIYPIRHNNIADYFILSAWDDRHSLNPLYIWAFHKDDMVIYKVGRSYILKKFYDRETFTITNTPESLSQFKEFEITGRLDKLKELLIRI